MREKDTFSEINQHYGSTMIINDRDCEDAQIELLAARINRRYLGHKTGPHGDDITLPRCMCFGTNQYEMR